MSGEWPHLSDEEPAQGTERPKMISELGMYPKGWLERLDGLKNMQSLPDNVFTVDKDKPRPHEYRLPEVCERPRPTAREYLGW